MLILARTQLFSHTQSLGTDSQPVGLTGTHPEPAGRDSAVDGAFACGRSLSFCFKKDLASFDLASTSLVTLRQEMWHQVYKRNTEIKSKRQTDS